MSIIQDRISERVRAILSELMLREVSDPRLKHVTITEVQIDAELVYAKVFVNALGDESRQAEVMKGLTSAKGFLRREVGKRLHLKSTPDLTFIWDDTLERGERLNQIIAKLDLPPADPESGEDDDE
jgi:ribosome-binding factor A